MSAIDKIYTSSFDEWFKFHNWCANNKRKCWNKTHTHILKGFIISDLQMAKRVFQFGNQISITNFCWKTDYWLMKHCPFKFVQDRLKEQYRDHFDEKKRKKIRRLHIKY